MPLSERHRKLKEQGLKLFEDRRQLESFWQDCALAFYPEMAEFTAERTLGAEYADHLATSYPILARRTLGNAFSALLRPTALDTTSPGVWFSLGALERGHDNTEAKRWLEWATGIQRRAMYRRDAMFARAAKEGDHAFATFGQAVLSAQINRQRTGLLYQSHHLKDVAWTENSEGAINGVWRRWKPYAFQLVDAFGQRASPKAHEKLKDNPYCRIDCLHIMTDAELYELRERKGARTPWVSTWLDCDNDHEMEERGSWGKVYIIPRWMTIPGSQYASSPAVTAALPDARLIQSMAFTIREAGEKFVDPPMVAVEEAVKGGTEFFAGGVTWIDAEFDERSGSKSPVRPLFQPSYGQGIGAAAQMEMQVRDDLARAFFLDSLSLPPPGKDMTAYEVGQRMSEWIRRAMPIFEPMEFEYNGQLCEETFEILLRNGAFGAPHEIPEALRGQEIQFKFESPLHESADRRKGQKFLESKALIIEAMELDRASVRMLNVRKALRDALGSVAQVDWTNSDQEIEAAERAQAEQDAAMQSLAIATEGSRAVKDIGAAVKNFSDAQGQAV